MDYDAYRRAFFADPQPEPRFQFSDAFNVALYFEKYDAVVDYYTRVLGPPAYIEGEGTRGWRVGAGWLTLFHGGSGGPQNIEVIFWMATPTEAERLQGAFIAAGGEGFDPSDELMYEPVRFCAVRDPFGTDILIISPLQAG